MEKIKDEKLRKILQEMAELLKQVYGNRLKAVILYGSVARGTQTEDSDVDIMVLVDVQMHNCGNMMKDLAMCPQIWR